MQILVTGASGFAGSQLIPRLLSHGHAVRALARDPARVDVAGIVGRAGGSADDGEAGTDSRQALSRPPLSLSHRRGAPAHTGAHEQGGDGGGVNLLTGDVLTGEGLARALREVEVAYYLIHSMERAPSREHVSPFPERERRAAENFAAAAAKAGVRRIVYLGGPTASWADAGRRAGARAGKRAADLSPHLRSREAVERVLREAVPDTVALRASIVIGARSRSFRFLVRLVERLPVLALPSWRAYRTRPIDARDVTDMLVAAGALASVAGRSLDVGGPDILSYKEMIQRIAELMLLPRPVVGLGVSARPLSSAIAAAIAQEDPTLVSALMESLQGDLLPGGSGADSYLKSAERLGVELHSYDSAVERALREWESVEPLAAR